MQAITARNAQTNFGHFSREAQKDTVIVTNHGHPVFMAIPIKMTASIARLIREASPADGIEASDKLKNFFTQLNATQAKNPPLSEDEISDLIKQNI